MKVLVNGASAFVSTGGLAIDTQQPTLVMLHGSGLNRTVWILLARYFARRGFNVVAPDLPGHGASEGEPPQTIEEQGVWVNNLLDVLAQEHGLPTAQMTVVGHSMGSLTAIETTVGRLADVNRLILLGTSYPMAVGDALLAAAKANDYAAIDMISIFGHANGSRLGANRVPGISALNMAMVLLEQAAPGVLHNDLAACQLYRGAEAAGDAMKESVQVSIIAGDQDKMTSMKGTVAVQQLFNAELHVLTSCGHMQMSEQPEQTLQALKRILDVD
ncbi:MAG: alpha/beta hydrolase [Gammaproteobacteria bacterium]|nr:alpha/beta hydrolase [Gammaproteobacteria bacterium]